MVRGNSHLMKLLSPKQLHKWLIADKYDIEVSYLEGSCTRIISGCPDFNTKLVSLIHIQQKDAMQAAASFRNIKEATRYMLTRFIIKLKLINALHFRRKS